MTSADRETVTVRRLLAWRGWPELAAIGVLVLMAAYVAVTTVHMISVLALRTPFWDNWLAVIPEKFLARPFAQHNEHRIFVGRVFLALDFRLFGGQGWFCLAANVVLLVGTAAMLAWAAGRGMPRVRATIFALGLTFLLSAYTWENFVWPFQIAMVGVVPAALVAFIALTRQTPIAGNVALLAAAAATYSAGNGVLVPMLLVVLAVVIGSPRRDIVVLSLFAVALLASYLVGFDNVEHRTPMSAFRDPRLFFRYLSVYVGAPFSWGYTDRLLASQIHGFVGLALSLAVLVTSFLKRRSMTPSDWVLPFAILFTVGSGAITAIGRMYYSIDQALASRYGVITFFFWTALIAQIVRSAAPVLMRSGATVLACALAIKVASHQEEIVAHVDDRLAKIRHAETALAADALDVEAINLITPSPYLVKDALPTLKQRRWSIYREPWVAWLGTKLSDHVRQNKARACAGA